MAEKLAPGATVGFDELLVSNVYTQEALVNLVEEKGIITKAEFLEEIKTPRDRQKGIKVRCRLLPERIHERIQ
jgi:hypothetical protein